MGSRDDQPIKGLRSMSGEPAGRERPELRILLVEDDVNFAHMLMGELRSGRTAVDWVGNGVEAVLSLMRQPFDVVLLDLRMPRLDGIPALRIIRIIRPEAAVITFSGLAGKAEMEESVQLGARACLAKPFRISELRHMLNLPPS
jgi:DNA-binding response OmpR family regulator